MHLSIRKVKPTPRLYQRLLKLELYEPGWSARRLFEVGADFDKYIYNSTHLLKTILKFYVARVDGKTIGWSILFERGGLRNKFIWTYVKPEFRRKGIGKRLVKRCKVGLDINQIKVDRSYCYQDSFWDVVLV